MKKVIFFISFVCLTLVTFTSHAAKKKTARPDIHLETRVDNNHTVEGERLIYEVVLYSTDFSIAGAEILSNPDFQNLSVARAASNSHIDEIEINGTKYITTVIDRFFIGTNHEGKYSIKGGDYRIGFNRQTTFNDPFWGPSVVNTIETIDLMAPGLNILVDKVPEKGRTDDFSGAVGRYEVGTELHSGCVAGEKSCLYVTISGKGDLTNAKLPEVASAFKDGLRFKSMTENRSHFIHRGSLGSEIELECEFIADKPGKYVIQPIEFTFYDTLKKEYVTTSSKPIEIEVKEAKRSKSAPPATMDI